MNVENVKKNLEELKGRNELKGATWSISLKNIKYKSIFEFNSDTYLIPASTLKILTTATALKIFGPSYTFQTNVYSTGKIDNYCLSGNIIVKGIGDPTFGSRDFASTTPINCFKSIFEMLQKYSITEISGAIIVDSSFINADFSYRKWTLEDYPFYYGAIPKGLNFLDNYFSISLDSEGIHMEQLKGIESDLLKKEFRLVPQPEIENLKITGCPFCATTQVFLNPNQESSKKKDYKLALRNPSILFTELLTEYLTSRGILIKNSIPKENNDEPKLIGSVISPTMFEILQNINFKSNNFFAESIYQILAKIFAEQNENLNEYWMKQIANDKFRITDGSGLSRISFMTTNFISELLMYMYLNKDNFGNYFETLPQLAKEGTAIDYCKEIKAKNIVRVKTGSMKMVRAFAGIIESENPLSFSLIFNNYQCTDIEIKEISESILALFAEE